MLFNSYIFIFAFLPFIFFLYFILNNYKLVFLSKLLLIFASLVFYAYWNIDFLPLLIISILINYSISQIIIKLYEDKNSYLLRKTFFWIGIVFNILLLCYFKYMNFFIENINIWFSADINLLNILLPLAISFYTIQQIIYLIDTYENRSKETSLTNYFLFVTFFPQLVAGPIVHHKEMMPQFNKLKNKFINHKNISIGLFIFSIGLFKKVVLANIFASYSSAKFNNFPEDLSVYESWIASFSYTFQVYFDFSGYTDMAIGIALLFNVRLPVNFNSPFQAKNVIDFWSRWHITLTNFITIYLYTAIVRSYKNITFEKMMLTTIFVMVIVGIWHGATWGWIFFGLIHGLAMVLNHYWKKTKIKLSYIISWFLTFNFVNLSLVLVRTDSINSALTFYEKMFSFNQLNNFTFNTMELFVILGTILLIHVKKNSNYYYKNMYINKKILSFGILLLFISLISLSNPTEFIYFKY